MIPREAHFTWPHANIADQEHDMIRLGLKSFQTLHPGWSITVHTDHDLDQYLMSHLSPGDWALLEHRHPVEKSDVWRLLLLYNQGGLYMDLDRWCNRSLDDLIDDSTRLVLPTCGDLDFSHDFMCTAAGNPIMLRALELNLARRRQGHTNVYFLGPQTYMNAASQVILGEMLQPNPGRAAFDRMRDELEALGYVRVFREHPPTLTLLFQPQEGQQYPDHEATKRDWYRINNIRHWTGQW